MADAVTKSEFEAHIENHNALHKYVHEDLHPRIHEVENKVDATEWEVAELLKPRIMKHDKLLTGNGEPSIPEQIRKLGDTIEVKFRATKDILDAWGFWMKAIALILLGELLVAGLALVWYLIQLYIRNMPV